MTPGRYRFTAADWDTPKPFTVTALDDADASEDTDVLAHQVTGGDYAGLADQDLPFTVNDDDTPSTGIMLGIAPTEVAEAAGATPVTVTATLNGAPRGNPTEVTVGLTVDGEATVSTGDFVAVTPFTLTIPAGDRFGTAVFDFDPVGDAVDEEDETVRVFGGTAATQDGITLTVTDALLTILDDDRRAVSATPGRVDIAEGDSAGAVYRVLLISQPTATVTVTASGQAGTGVTVSPSTLTFTTANWDDAQEVTVTAAEDDDAADETVTLTRTVRQDDHLSLVGSLVGPQRRPGRNAP